MSQPPPKTYEEAVARAVAAFVCDLCGSRKVICVDRGGGTPRDPWADVEAAAWQCVGCGVMMGTRCNYGDDEEWSDDEGAEP